MNLRYVSLFLLVILFTSCEILHAAATHSLPRPPELEPDINFWKRVFTKVDTNHGLIHDNRHLAVVYEVISIPQGISRKKRGRVVEKVKKRYRKILLSLAKGKRNRLTKEERRVLNLWPNKVSNETLRTAASRLRFQLGQADKFKLGWIRSGAWRSHIEEVLTEHGVPKELAALPHVESSFNPKAYSHVGAAGLWQFTRTTGRRYMRVDHVVDERLDPFKSSDAAARLLRYNFELLGTWPLAITAYNHGAAGMRRAVKKVGSTDIAPILRNYRSRTFGFASRNFYPAFVAAVEVDQEAKRHFGKLHQASRDKTQTLATPAYVKPEVLQEALDIDRETLRRLNPALRASVWRGQKLVPKGFELRVPCTHSCAPIKLAMNSLPATQRYGSQLPDRYHKVRRGDTLSQIARRYKVSSRTLASLNSLRSRHTIRVGQMLRLPWQDHATTSTSKKQSSAIVASAARTNKAKPNANGLYSVKAGDTIEGIARRFGLDQHTLLALNDVRNRNKIYIGQVLKVTSRPPTKTSAPLKAKDEQSTPAKISYASLTQPADGNTMTDAISQSEAEVSVPEEDTEPLGPALPSEIHPTLSADPSDYTVAADGTIQVQAAETLGHYADWLGIRTQVLRNINKLRYGKPLPVGTRLKLDFSKRSPQRFESLRTTYHCELQSEFFKNYSISDTRTHVVKLGESLWSLTHQKYQIPVWLMRQYNPDLDFHDVRPGMKLSIPMLSQRSESDVSKSTAQTSCDRPNDAANRPTMAL